MASGGRPNNEKPVTLDFALTRGTWLEGTVTDAHTKKPVAGARLEYAPLDDTTLKQAAGEQAAFDDVTAQTDAAGRFKIAVLPGPGGIGIDGPNGPYVTANRWPLQGDSLFWTYEGVRVRWTRVYFRGFDALAVVEVDARKLKTYSFTLDAGATVTGRVLDPDGQPLAGAQASRLTENGLWTIEPLPTERFEVKQVTASGSRVVLFWHGGRKLGAMVRPAAGDKGPDVRLKPNSSATGRLLDADKKPAADHPIEIMMRLPGDIGWAPWFPQMKVRTDAAGRFEIPNLPEGPEFSLRYSIEGAAAPDRHVREFQVPSGKTFDIGDLGPR